MAKERADLGFNDPLGDFDPADWKPPDSKASTETPTTQNRAASVLMVKAFEVSIVCFQIAANLLGLPTFSSRQ